MLGSYLTFINAVTGINVVTHTALVFNAFKCLPHCSMFCMDDQVSLFVIFIIFVYRGKTKTRVEVLVLLRCLSKDPESRTNEPFCEIATIKCTLLHLRGPLVNNQVYLS